jgi:hypothetical protein
VGGAAWQSTAYQQSLIPLNRQNLGARANTNASFYVKLLGDLKWNASFYGNWDNRPPPSFSGSDYGTSSGLSWTFGFR